MIGFLIVYVAVVMLASRYLVRRVFVRLEKKLADQQADYQKCVAEKNAYFDQKMALEDRAIQIFTLYEMTKDITQSQKEAEALELFKKKLREHVRFAECLLLDVLPEAINLPHKGNHYWTPDQVFVFSLHVKRRRLGYLVVTGMPAQEEDKLMILGHQFALALRRVKLYEEIERIAITDSLTAVHTRRYALERFAEEVSRSKNHKTEVSFLMADVDHFKTFNDQYGHFTGDQVLREVGQVIKTNIREIDIDGRFGGEEFCVILPDTGSDGAKYAAERIRLAMEKTVVRAYDGTYQVTLSIGIATFPQDGKTAEEILEKADWALYRAKQQGRNRVAAVGVYTDKAAGKQHL
ncbi:MAG: GGDEF domain-containing protein [Candidatus Omnitrophica bacterium]|nr:GGDEF domain-containing protein [Candidatus Omnitrophota bacterium]